MYKVKMIKWLKSFKSKEIIQTMDLSNAEEVGIFEVFLRVDAKTLLSCCSLVIFYICFIIYLYFN